MGTLKVASCSMTLTSPLTRGYRLVQSLCPLGYLFFFFNYPFQALRRNSIQLASHSGGARKAYTGSWLTRLAYKTWGHWDLSRVLELG